MDLWCCYPKLQDTKYVFESVQPIFPWDIFLNEILYIYTIFLKQYKQ